MHGHWLLARAASLFPDTELAHNVSAVFDQQFTEEKARGAAFHLGTKTLSRLEQSWTTSNKSSAPPLRGLTAGLGFLNFKKSLKQALRCWNKVHDIVNLWKCENLWKRSPTASQLRWRELAGLTSWGPSPPMWPLSSIPSYPGFFLKRMRDEKHIKGWSTQWGKGNIQTPRLVSLWSSTTQEHHRYWDQPCLD